MLSFEAIVLIIVFSLVLITMLIYLRMKKSGKEIKRWFKILMFFVLLTGVRHLNPLRWPETAIRGMILLYTPVGMSGADVIQRVDNVPLWTRREPPRYIYLEPGTGRRSYIYFEPGRRGVRATLGTYYMFFIIGGDVEARWRFDENGYLYDVEIFKILAL